MDGFVRMHLLYSFALTLAVLLGSPAWIYKMLRHGKYRAGLRERLGRVPARVRQGPTGDCIWIHAVSVGEALAITRLVEELKSAFPGWRIVVSTTTTTGQNLARERFGAENVFYFPLDFGFCIRPYLRALKPRLVIMAETEFWPNFLRLAKTSGARVAVVNARISDRSLPGYQRWRGLLAKILRNVDLFLAQSDEDQRRLIAIGAEASRVRVSGNLKFDVTPPQKLSIVEQLRAAIIRGGGGPVIVAGSTVGNEEFVLLGAFQVLLREFPTAVLVLAPRHPERFDEVWNLLPGFGTEKEDLPTLPGLLRFDRARRSSADLATLKLRGAVLLLDTIGELAAMYDLADVAIVGGSFERRGGHNILEPAHFGKAIVIGPHSQNFRDIVAIFQRADAVRIAHAYREGDVKGDLSDVLASLLRDQTQREQLGTRAAQVLASQRGASRRTADALKQLLGGRA
jgi:3-deoxy-D-manno-octulosonic-acid transferase